jgi:hypothetical protein
MQVNLEQYENVEVLSNGAIVIDTKKDMNTETERVLCLYPHAIGNLVSWTRRLDTPNSVFWGHYYSSFEQASAEWNNY